MSTTPKNQYGIGMGLAVGLFVGLGIFMQLGLITADVTTIASLNAGIVGTEIGQSLIWNGTSWMIDNPDNPSLVATLKDDFYSGATNCSTVGQFFTGAATGTSACGFNNADTIHRGLVSLTTSAGATDGIRFASQVNSVTFGTVPACVTWLWKIHNLSDAATQYVDRVGYAEPTTNADSVDAVEAAYDWANNGNVHKWQLTTRSNSVGTNTICTGSTGDIAADQWFRMKICVDAAAANATLTINGNLCATNTTNIPTGIARATAIGAQHFNATGSVPIAQLSFVDFVKEVAPFPVPR